MACASFDCAAGKRHEVFARNYDYAKTDTCIVYTTPVRRHASVSTVDLQFLGLMWIRM